MKQSLLILLFSILTLALFVNINETDDGVFKWDKNKKLDYLIYGKSWALELRSAKDIVAARWGFKYKEVAGCMVTDKLVDSVRSHNEKVNQALATKFGKDWEKSMEKDFDIEFSAEKKAITLVESQKEVIQKNTKLKNQNSSLEYCLKQSNGTSAYKVYVCGWETVNGNENKFFHYFKYSVDLTKSYVKRINGTFINFD